MIRPLIDLSDHAWERTWARLEGLGDQEYLWEPVVGSWSVRPGPDGALHPEFAWPEPDPPPVTNIAWRLCHLIVCYGEKRNRQWLGLAADGPDDFERQVPAPATAAEALDRLARARAEWARTLSQITPEALGEKLGPVAGPFEESDRAEFVLHMIDEFIHHGAEVALLRDLWRAGGREGVRS